MASDNRKTFRLDQDVADLLQQRLEKGSYGSTENAVLNSLLRNITKQEKEIVDSHNLRLKVNDQLAKETRRADAAEEELTKLTNALMLVGSYLNPLGK